MCRFPIGSRLIANCQLSMFQTLLLATTNAGKIREIRIVLDGVPLALVTLADIPAIAEPSETGWSCAENAF